MEVIVKFYTKYNCLWRMIDIPGTATITDLMRTIKPLIKKDVEYVRIAHPRGFTSGKIKVN